MRPLPDDLVSSSASASNGDDDDNRDAFYADPNTFVGRFHECMDALKIEMAPVDKVILPDNSEYLEAELERREALRAEENAEGADETRPQVRSHTD